MAFFCVLGLFSATGGTKLAIFMLAFTEILKSQISGMKIDIDTIMPGGGAQKFR